MTTTSKKKYPDQLNPFGEDEGQEEEDDNNPFKSDDDEEETPKKSHETASSVQQNAPPLFPSSNGLSPLATKQQSIPSTSVIFTPEIAIVENGPEKSVRPKPSPLPRRSLMVSSEPTSEPKPSPVVELPISPLPPRADGTVVDPSSTTPVKRRAPSIPLADLGHTLRPLPSPEKSPVAGVKKKLAPPPPMGSRGSIVEDQRRKSSTDFEARSVEERLADLKISSGRSSPALSQRRDSGASASSCTRGSLTPDQHSISQHITSSVEDLEEQQYLDLMRTLREEHHAIEGELRELMAIPTKLRSSAQDAREQRLMKDLLENVRKRDELEDETEEHDLQTTLGDSGVPGAAPKKMKKKRKFRMKNLLGVK